MQPRFPAWLLLNSELEMPPAAVPLLPGSPRSPGVRVPHLAAPVCSLALTPAADCLPSPGTRGSVLLGPVCGCHPRSLAVWEARSLEVPERLLVQGAPAASPARRPWVQRCRSCGADHGQGHVCQQRSNLTWSPPLRVKDPPTDPRPTWVRVVTATFWKARQRAEQVRSVSWITTRRQQ